MDAFDNELSRKRAEFNQFNARPTPPQVDFADKEEDTSGDVNRLLEQAMRERENLEVPKPVDVPDKNTTPIRMSVQEKVEEKPTFKEMEMLVSKINKNEEILINIMSKLEGIEEMLNTQAVLQDSQYH